MVVWLEKCEFKKNESAFEKTLESGAVRPITWVWHLEYRHTAPDDGFEMIDSRQPARVFKTDVVANCGVLLL